MAKTERKTAQDIFAEREKELNAGNFDIKADERYEIDEAAEETYEAIEPQQEAPTAAEIVISDGGESFSHDFMFTVRAEELFTKAEADSIFDHFTEGITRINFKPEPLKFHKSSLDFKFSRETTGVLNVKMTAPFIKFSTEVIPYVGFSKEFYIRINELIQTAIKTTPALYNELAKRLSAEIDKAKNTAAEAVAEQTIRVGAVLMRMRDEGIFPGGMNLTKGQKITVKDDDGNEKEVDPFYYYVEKEHGYKESWANSTIGIVRKYCLIAADGSPRIKDEFKDYGHSQLLLLERFTKKGLELPPASMSSREMERQLKADKAAADSAPAVTNDFEAEEDEENSDVAERLPGGEPVADAAPGIIKIEMKSDKEREQFLNNCKEWKLWKPWLSLRCCVRRAKLSDGSIILAFMYTYPMMHYSNGQKAVVVESGTDFYFYPPEFAKEGTIYFSRRFLCNGNSEIVNHIRENKLFAVI